MAICSRIFVVCLLLSESTWAIDLEDDPGEPLFLSKYLEKGDIEGGRKASKVPPIIEGIESYAGYITVDPKYDSNMFFWYFPGPNRDAPVVVWLQGGPGSSSMYGLFYENGPLMLSGKKVKARVESWSRVSNIIFIDNPVGTGFSFTNSWTGYMTDEVGVGKNLYSTLIQFFQLFTELQNNDLFITGESYGGKYVPALAYTIHTNNPKAHLKLKLKGIAMGNGLCDPVNMMIYSKYLYEIGLIDSNTKELFQAKEDAIRSLINEENWVEATLAFGQLILGYGAESTMFQDNTAMRMFYNYLKSKDDDGIARTGQFLNRNSIRKKIHVGNLTYNDGALVERYLMADIMKSIAPWLTELLNNYRVFIYNGQLDIIVAYPLTLGYLQKIDWCGSELYSKTERKEWTVNGQLAGYSRTVKPTNCNGSLVEVLVRNAGHMVPHDQPAFAFDLITKLVKHIEF